MPAKSIIIRFCISLAASSPCFSHLVAQNFGTYTEDEAVNMQSWMDYNPRYLINNRSTLYVGVGGRTIFPKAWYRVYLSPSIRYDLTIFISKTERYRTWQLHGGVGLFYTHAWNLFF